jgi:hypothetical protein
MSELTRVVRVICNSADRQSQGTGADFQQHFGVPILQGESDDWEVALLELELSGTPTSDVMVYCTVGGLVQIGSERRRLLRAIPKNAFQGSYYRAEAPLEWAPLAAALPLTGAGFSIANRVGALIPTTSSLITLAFRRSGNLH